MATARMPRGIDRLLESVPRGVELSAAQSAVAHDLVSDGELADVVAPTLAIGRSDIPRIRPILVALAARSTGASSVDGESQHAAELLHLALRVHDVLLGQRGGRRRRLARGIASSIEWMTGHRLALRAIEIARHAAPGVADELLETLRAFAEAQDLSGMLVGEIPERQDWLEHADGHTGALFSFCCRAGGLLGGNPRLVSAVGRYGRHTGRLWHIAEDVSALQHGEPGVHLAARAAAGRPMLPVVLAIERDPSIGDAWRRLAAEGDAQLANELAPRIRDHGLAASREILTAEMWRAQRAVRVAPESAYRRVLERLAASVAKASIRRAP